MKILILDTYYQQFLRGFYAKHPHLDELDYEKHRACLMAERFATSDAYSHYFKEQGCEAEEIIINDGHLQAKWARENGIPTVPLPNLISNGFNLLFGRDWRFTVLQKQIEQKRPDVILIQEQSILTDSMITDLKIRSRALTVSQINSPLLKRRRYRSVDLVLGSVPYVIESIRRYGICAEYVNLCFDKRVLDEITKGPKEFDITFIGGISKGHHGKRSEILERLAQKFSLQWFGYGEANLEPDSALRSCWKGQVWGLEMYDMLGKSRSTINCHIDVAGDYGANMRLFEATGVGTCLVTDWNRNLQEFFEPNQEVVAYRSVDDLTAKIAQLLDNPEENARISEAGQSRTLEAHTYEQRVPEILSILKRYADHVR